MQFKIFILLAMIFCHIIDDYNLQGWLASAKQKSFWEENAPESLYKYDYIMALFMHSLSWSFMIMLPAMLYLVYNGYNLVLALILFIINIVIHAIVDDLKANKRKINLIQDQLVHLIQIMISWVLVIITLP